MDCLFCAKLKREFSAEAEAEARATLQQRFAVCSGVRLTKARYEFLQNEIEQSRKRQAALSENLTRHIMNEHRFVDDEMVMSAC